MREIAVVPITFSDLLRNSERCDGLL